MAKHLTTVEAGLHDLEREITCAICQDIYEDPRLLPCFHYYCFNCIQRLACRGTSTRPSACPECRAKFVLPEGMGSGLPTAFFINRIKEKFVKLRKACGDLESNCESCSENIAQSYCRQCQKMLCHLCVEFHAKMKALFPNHETIPLTAVSTQEAKKMLQREPVLQKCDDHDEPLKIFCFTCKTIICRDCTMREHNGHKYEHAKTAAPKAREHLEKLTKSLAAIKEDQAREMAALTETRHQARAQGEVIHRSIDDCFHKFNTKLTMIKNKVHQDTSAALAQTVAPLTDLESRLQQSSTAIDTMVEYATQSIRHSSDEEIISMLSDVEVNMTKAKESHTLLASTHYTLADNLGVQIQTTCEEELAKLCAEQLKASQQLTQSYTLRYSQAEERIEWHAILTIVSVPGHSELCNQATISCLCRSEVDSSTHNCNITSQENGTYLIKYTPNLRGRHSLKITVNSKQILGSPFPIYALPSLSSLGRPVRIWDGIAKPVAVAVDPNNHILVVKYQGDIIVFNQKGHKLESLKWSSHMFEDVSGIACSDNKILATTFSANCVYEYDTSNKKIHARAVEQLQGPGHWGICLVGDKIALSERNFSKAGVIRIHSKEFEPILHIEGGFTAVASHEGCLFAFDRVNLLVKTFSIEGACLQSFKTNSKMVLGMFVKDDRLYLSDCRSHTISVVSTTGEQLAVFGKKGKGNGEFQNPRGIAVDKDGFIYVCDDNNDRIQVF